MRPNFGLKNVECEWWCAARVCLSVSVCGWVCVHMHNFAAGFYCQCDDTRPTEMKMLSTLAGMDGTEMENGERGKKDV